MRTPTESSATLHGHGSTGTLKPTAPAGDTKADDLVRDTEGDVARRAADFMARGIARSRRSNSEGFGE